MSTNYYMKPKLIDEVLNLLKSKSLTSLVEFDLNEEVANQLILELDEKDTYWLHIGKRSGGRKPTFYQSKYWSSVEDIIDFYNKNKDKVSIVDEYGTKLTIEELKENLIYWNKDNPEALTPFDSDSGVGAYWIKNYYKDKDGYIFTTDIFS